MRTKLSNSSQMQNLTTTITVQVNDDAHHPLMVTAKIEAEYGADDTDTFYGWTWKVIGLLYVELVVGDKVGIDITDQILRDTQAKAILTALTADCDLQIYKQLQERRVA